MDMSLINGGFSFLNGAITQYFGNKSAKYQADAANGIRQGNNVVVAATNARNAQLTAMQRWAKDVRNSRVQEAVAANQEALTTNFNRARDARTRQNFATNVRQAEESGRMQAAAAASGVTGSVVDVVNMTANLRNGMQNVARLDAEAQINYDEKQTEFQSRQALLDSLDFQLILDNPEIADMRTDTAKQGSIIGAGLGNNGALANLIKGGTNTVNSFFNSNTDNSIFGMLGTNRSMGD